MVINQGDIFWIELDEPSDSEPGYRHPHVVIQNNVFNRSRINTVVVCTLTSNLRRAAAPGNVLLEPGEATDFRALEATTTVVVKMPSVIGDKYPVDRGETR